MRLGPPFLALRAIWGNVDTALSKQLIHPNTNPDKVYCYAIKTSLSASSQRCPSTLRKQPTTTYLYLLGWSILTIILYTLLNPNSPVSASDELRPNPGAKNNPPFLSANAGQAFFGKIPHRITIWRIGFSVSQIFSLVPNISLWQGAETSFSMTVDKDSSGPPARCSGS